MAGGTQAPSDNPAPDSSTPVQPRGGSRASLLQPGQSATFLAPIDWVLLALLYVLAFVLRWDLRSAQPYIAETWHYFVAQHLWHSRLGNVVVAGGPLDLSWFFWQRPLLTLPFHLFALHSFAAYRAAHIVLASTVPPL